MPDGTLLTPEIREALDRDRRLARGEVTEKEIKRFAYATDDLNGIYLDDACAKSAGLPGIVAPPLSVVVFTREDHPLGELQEDGIGKARGRSVLYQRLPRVVAGGTEYDFFQHIRPGDVLTSESRTGNVFEKQGRSGPLLFVESVTTWTNQRGEKVAVQRFTAVYRPQE